MKNAKSILTLCFTLATAAILSFSPVLAGSQRGEKEQPGVGFEYTGDARFQRLTVEAGLPSTEVLGVLQDRQGFIWFATADGLSRYDGYQFVTFRHDRKNPNSLSHNYVFSLLETRDGLIWAGTDPGGLNVYDPKSGKFQLYLHDPQNPNSLPNDSIWSLLEARDGSLWIGTRGGLSHFNRRSGTFTNYLPNSEDPRALAAAIVYRLYQTADGTIWVATRNGLQRYEAESDDFTTFRNDPHDPTSLSHSTVWAMLEDDQGNFWVGTRGGGLNLFDRATGKAIAYRHDPNNANSLSDDRIFGIYQDAAQRIWITTENGGLNLFDRKSGIFTSYQHNPNDPFSLSSNDLFWMCEDESGVLWITSRNGGVNALYPALQRFGWYRHIPEDPNTLKSSNVYAILPEANDVLWIGTFGSGLHRLDRHSGEMQVFQNNPADPTSLSADKIYSIFRDEQGVLWVATSGGGLNRMDETGAAFTAFKRDEHDPGALRSNFITTIDSAGKGRLWIGTLGFGLALFDTATGKVLKEYRYDQHNPNSLREETIYDVTVARDGKVWIATARGGLELLDPQTDQFTHYMNDPDDPNTILSNTVFSIYLDEANGLLWAGTVEGLSRLDLTAQTWQHFSSPDSQASAMIVGVQPDGEGGLWVSTSQGLSHLQAGLEIYQNFDVRDGLQGNQFNIASTALGPDGEVFFGGPNGLNYFYTSDIFTNLYEPRVVLTGFELFNLPVTVGNELLPKPIEYTQTITLPHDQSVFTIEFAGLSYQNSSRNLYRYRLDGFDPPPVWSPPKPIRHATYTNLAPGTYTFKVHATNHDNTMSRNPAQLRIIILPPWWQTWWFRLLVAGGLFGLVVGGVHWRVQQIRRINSELEKRVLERTTELRDEIRLRQAVEDQLRQTNEALQVKLAEIIELQNKLREQAVRDALTGLLNRHHLAEIMHTELSRAGRAHYQVTFMLIDLDHFKDINDNFGHQAGDIVLQTAGQMLNQHIRQGDYAFRYGGEEFLVILPGTSPKDALRRAEQLRADFIALKTKVDGNIIDITASIGVAIYPIDGDKSEEILRYVDEALYQAKGKGRDRVIIAPNTRKILNTGD